MNIDSPLYYEFSMQHSYSNTYKPYWVYLRTWRLVEGGYFASDDRLLYVGKTFCSELDADHSYTKIDVAPILKDFVWHFKTKYNETTQKYVPYNYVNTNSPALTCAPIEMDDNYLALLNAEIAVEVGNQGGGYLTVKAVNTLLFTQWQHSYNIQDPYDEHSATGLFTYNSFGTEILPEIPLDDTSNFWLCVNLGTTRQWQGGRQLSWFATSDSATPTESMPCYCLNTNGNYSFCPSLKRLYTNLSNAANGDTLYYGITYNSATATTPVAKISDCNEDFYVSWVTPWQSWQCQPFKLRRTTIGANHSATQITTIDNRQKVVKNETKHTYQLTSGFVTKEKARLLQTIPSSFNIYVYDYNEGVGYWCICTNRNVSLNNGQNLFEVVLELEEDIIYIR